mgnify:CR=1 FL=1
MFDLHQGNEVNPVTPAPVFDKGFILALHGYFKFNIGEYAVNVDEEMARLMELQNAYAANARVLSVVQELLDALMNA